MKFFIKFACLSLLLMIAVSMIAYRDFHKPLLPAKIKNRNHEGIKPVGATLGRLKLKANHLKAYLKEQHYNNTYCFLIDMKISSGHKRFFVYNIKKDSIEMAGLVTHGSGIQADNNEIEFSNITGSNCSSLGNYKIGKSYHGKFGLAYKLYGLDRTNSHAFERFVVLHSHDCVPDDEVYPVSICESWGCPTVSPMFLQNLRRYIDEAKEPILLSIFN